MLLVAGSSLAADLRVGLAAFAVAAWLRAIMLAGQGFYAPRAVVWSIAAGLLITAVLLPPYGSQDVWSYVVQGRMVAFHGLSPYTHEPGDFALSDPFVARVPHGWRLAQSPYGPLQTVIEAMLARVGGNSVFFNRFFYQAIAAMSAVGVAARYDRGGPPRAATYLLLAPVTVTIVNGGHTDLLLGALLALGYSSAQRGKSGAAVASLAAAALLRPTALVFVVGLVAWSSTRPVFAAAHAKRGLGIAVGVGGLVVAGYVLAGGTAAVLPLLHAAGETSRVTLWAAISPATSHLGHSFGTASLLTLVGTLSVLAYRRYRHEPTPRPLGVGLACATLVSLPYVMPWYVGWTLPLGAGDARHESSLLAAAIAGALAIGYANPPGTAQDWFAGTVSAVTIPIAVVLAASMLRRRPARLRC